MNIGIIGQGFVGTAVYEGLKQYFKIETYDIAKKSTCSSIGEVCEKSDVVFVCLPTPMHPDGSCSTLIVQKVLNEINDLNTCNTVVVK